jgi:ribosomal protein S18 acetylase RimI-like enzyme
MIREITESDVRRDFLSLMAEVEAGSWFDRTNASHSEWLCQRISQRIGGGGQFYALYSPDNTPLGLYCVLIEVHPIFPGHAEILDIGIFQNYRRQGHGRRLVEDAARRAAAAGACCLYVSTYAGDMGAVAFYSRMGFRSVAELPGLNGPDDRGQMLMVKELGQQSPAAHPEALTDTPDLRTAERTSDEAAKQG